MPSRRRLACLLVAGMSATLFALGCGSPAAPTGGAGVQPTNLNVGGATFIDKVMQFWTEEYREKTGDKVKVNYQGTGSSDGVNKVTSKEYPFGCTDAPMNKGETAKAMERGGEIIHVPLVAGAVVPLYNLKIEKPLVFDGPLLADIYLGKVTQWNDPRIQQLNPGIDLPKLAIQPVFRSEGSGTSYVFTDYLSRVSPDFKAAIGASKQPKFPDKVGIGKKGSDGVTGHVGGTEGAIGYVELTFALDTKAKYGAVKNKSGKPVLASLASITKALEAALKEKQTEEPYSLHELTYNLNDLPGDDVYPICATSFAILYKSQPAGSGTAVVEFLKFCASADGQAMAEKRNYAPLPADLQKKIADKLATVEIAK